MMTNPTLIKSRFVRHKGRNVTVSLQNMSISGVLKEVEESHLAIETDVDGTKETVFVFAPSIVALKIEEPKTQGITP
jgi:ribosome maturation factor RimP